MIAQMTSIIQSTHTVEKINKNVGQIFLVQILEPTKQIRHSKFWQYPRF